VILIFAMMFAIFWFFLTFLTTDRDFSRDFREVKFLKTSSSV